MPSSERDLQRANPSHPAPPRAARPGLGLTGLCRLEWPVLNGTPEAAIRVDLSMIWPLLALLTLWAAVSAFRP